ncbi:OLC1v1036322C2 [Oldenlandia corymbosa var. corymbosa]|uniref:OLC1v1036322C2 n=1 Tax=Oldenlandia corymbosa var. corymbosa TaxID=529605 RepID=A0AAV1CY90_OLDCO|nr:OLC1v1036322C2 [Oldenlandia corymbosa var. corymbosa]
MDAISSSTQLVVSAGAAADVAEGAQNGVVMGKDKEAAAAAVAAATAPLPAYLSMVDPFLVEALQNPRHRLTILRMELDIQKFMQNSDLQQFEFPHFPTSYLRLAAHRVAQHYGLQTMVKDNAVDGMGIRIVARKQAASKIPTVCLSDVPAKQLENDKNEQVKIVIRSRPNRASSDETGESGLKRNSVRTVEERKEEYDRARARIFSGPGGSESTPQVPPSGKSTCSSSEDNETLKNSILDLDRNYGSVENSATSRVAILRDREKDRTDPDYDRSYVRYVKYAPSNQVFNVAPYVQKFQHPYVQYDAVLPQLGQMPGTQASLNYRSPVMNPYCAVGLNQASRDAVYMQWPTQSMMYAQSYGQLRHAVFQVYMPFFYDL